MFKNEPDIVREYTENGKGMVVGGILYYRVYPGSIPDKAYLKYMTEDNDVLSSRKTRFVAFIALIIRSYMQNRLSEYMNNRKYTFQKILLELDKVKLIHSANHENNCRLLNPSAKTQREIMEHLGLSPDAFACV